MGSFLRAKTIKILDGPLKFSLVTSMIFGGRGPQPTLV